MTQDQRNLQNAMGGATEIKNQSTAWEIRTANAPLLDKETQPVLYAVMEKIAEKRGISVEQAQTGRF